MVMNERMPDYVHLEYIKAETRQIVEISFTLLLAKDVESKQRLNIIEDHTCFGYARMMWKDNAASSSFRRFVQVVRFPCPVFFSWPPVKAVAHQGR